MDCIISCFSWNRNKGGHTAPFYRLSKPPFSASNSSWISGAYREKKPGNPARKTLLPNVPPYDLYAVSGMRVKCSGGTACAELWSDLVLVVTIPACGTAFKRLVLRANNAIVKFIIYILPTLVASLHRMRALVCCVECPVVIKPAFLQI